MSLSSSCSSRNDSFGGAIRQLVLLALLAFGTRTALANSSAAQPPRQDASADLTATPRASQKTSDALRARYNTEVRIEQVEANHESVREVLDIGLTGDEAGQMLMEARKRAPVLATVNQQVIARERELAQARLERVRLLERRRLETDAAEVERLTDEIEKQVAYKEALEAALVAERQLSKEAGELIALIDSRLLWVASAPPVGKDWLGEVGQGLKWTMAPENGLSVGRTALLRFEDSPALPVLAVLIVTALLLFRRRLLAKLQSLSTGIGKVATDSFGATAAAIGITTLLALPIPLALGSAGLVLSEERLEAFSYAFGKGLIAAGAVYLLLDIFRQLCRADGLADSHFGWNGHARRKLRAALRWLLPIEVAAALVFSTCDATGVELYQRGLGRLAFIVGSLGLMLFSARAFRPSSGIFSEIISRKGWAWRLRKGWYGCIVALPIALGVAAAWGYYYTAAEVQARLFGTGLVVLTGIFTYSLLKRWLLVARRRFALKQARERLALKRSEAAAVPEGAASGEAVPDLEVREIDVAAASAQALALLRTVVTVGVLAWLWAVWRQLLPALAVLEGVELSDPTFDSAGDVVIAPVTAWSILIALLTVLLTSAAARNLPAALELFVLQRFPMDHGARYAASTLSRYLIITIGLVVVSRLIGIDWSRAQWIVAALGVGLGFGLQEIVANFVSGIIILFERPIRVGDTVTVGADSGTVSRLRIRATTITDWDNKEILVPNKSFITDRVVNWTLSSPVTRLLLKIGVAYGTDEALAQRTIAQAVRSVPAVLEEPAFSVLFVGFGDSSLNFEVRAFVPELAKRMPALHDLNLAISSALRDAGIEIPFPQRDLHIRSSDLQVMPAPTPKPDEDAE